MPLIEIGAGELIDRITILQIKSERIADAGKRADVLTQLRLLCTARDAAKLKSDELNWLASDLKAVNEELWKAEDAIRLCETERSFETVFVMLARSIYRLNDKRTALKREIDILTGSKITDIKSYNK
jgi:hypothetical protein